VNYATCETLQLDAGLANDTINVTSTLAGMTLTLGGLNGNDAFNLTSNAATTVLNGADSNDTFRVTANTGPLTISGGNQDDTVTLGGPGSDVGAIQGTVLVNGDAGTADALIFDDTLNNNVVTYNVSSSSVTRTSGVGVGYGTFESMAINLGTNNDTVNVDSTLAATPLTVNGNTATTPCSSRPRAATGICRCWGPSPSTAAPIPTLCASMTWPTPAPTTTASPQ
jgi:hypothetical protein